MTEGLPRLALRAGPGLGLPRLARRYLVEYLDKITLAVGGLNETDIWWRPSEAANSIGNLMLHLCGNLSLWIGASLGGIEYLRDREGEFAATGGFSKQDLLTSLTQVVARCDEVLSEMDPTTLAGEHEIQGYPTDGLAAVFHAVEHMSYHTGQIVLLAKQLVDRSDVIDFYPQHKGE